MELLLLNTRLESSSILDTYSSLIWTDRYSKYGDFEIYTPVSAGLSAAIQEGFYLWSRDSEHTMIVESKEIVSDVEDLKGAQIMDKVVRTYSPSGALIVAKKPTYPVAKKIKRVHHRRKNLGIWLEVLAEKEAEIRALQKKYPWFNVLYNWLITACLISLAFSLIWWASDIHATKRVSAEYELQLETFYAEQEQIAQEERAALLAAQNSEAARRKTEYNLMAQFLDGITGFVENRGYSTNDLITYAQCPLNRVLNPAFSCSTLEEALSQEGQWVGFSENNQVIEENYEIAKKVIDDFYDNPVRPCSYEYCWTEFTDHGLYLKSDFGTATLDNTWRYNG